MYSYRIENNDDNMKFHINFLIFEEPKKWLKLDFVQLFSVEFYYLNILIKYHLVVSDSKEWEFYSD